jgi:phosphoglycerate dehydrogenase-like enzyme
MCQPRTPTILVALSAAEREKFLTDAVAEQLAALGTVTTLRDEDVSKDSLVAAIEGVDICLTSWSTPPIDQTVLDAADSLQLIGHIGGSVHDLCTEAVFERGITVTSANHVMSRYVAEWILGVSLSAAFDLPAVTAAMRTGDWPNDPGRFDSLIEADVGFVGLGDVGRNLLEFLAPFDVTVTIYDPYLAPDDEVMDRSWVKQDDLRTAVAADVVSIHAALTPETVGLIDDDVLAMMPESTILVNCARGPIVDTDALCAALADDALRAAVDVYDTEPLPEASCLRDEATVLSPHVAGIGSHAALPEAVLDDVERHLDGEPLDGAVSKERYELMTRSTGLE